MDNNNQEELILIEPIIVKIDRRKKHTDFDNYREYMKLTKYHTNYYHQTKQEILCDICGKKTFQRFLNQHKRSMKCRLTKIEADNKTKNEEA
jgi:hypothetical protein